MRLKNTSRVMVYQGTSFLSYVKSKGMFTGINLPLFISMVDLVVVAQVGGGVIFLED